jgi:16S rRNA (adenine1518-N6/adenine1519-N6)-dimethyltransferase
MNLREVKLILKQLNIYPNKQLGQNFLIDKNAVNKIISVAEVSENDVILEIGPGLGVLTEELAELSKKVYAIEIDPRLCSFLNEKFSKYDNVEIIHRDILEVENPIHNKVVSNIPYTITGPILEKIFYNKRPPEGIMVIEEKIADRIFFISDYKNYSRITISSNSFMKPISRQNISQNSFYPKPNISLSLIKMKPKEIINPFLFEKENREFFLRFIAGIMPYKNKNIVNALRLFLNNEKLISINKNDIIQILREKTYRDDKVFELSIEEFIELSKMIFNIIYKK